MPGDTDSLGSASPELSVAARNVKADNTDRPGSEHGSRA